jgi:Rrf2 family protein
MNPVALFRDYIDMYGKQTETAIAAVSYLAELWQGPRTRRVSAADIADARGLQRPFVAKLLSSLSQVNIVSGSPGPGGGYALAKDPSEIRLRDVWMVFERPDTDTNPLTGLGWRENKFHQRLKKVESSINELLDETTFEMMSSGDDSPPADDSKPGRLVESPSAIRTGVVLEASRNGNSQNGSGTKFL